MTKLVAFTGAGISKASGVPTFQELGDVREKLSRKYFESHPHEFYELLLGMKNKIDRSVPNPGHIALAECNIPVITMNIDGLHKKAGSKNLIEIHGNMEYVFCPRCKNKLDFGVVGKSFLCSKCNAVLQPNVVLYGDSLPLYADSIDLIRSAEELLVVGTSFYTSTASDLVRHAERTGIKVTVINESSETQVPIFLNKIL